MLSNNINEKPSPVLGESHSKYARNLSDIYQYIRRHNQPARSK